MSKIELINWLCADKEVDAIVNAANRNLWSGGGICCVIFKKSRIYRIDRCMLQNKKTLKDD